MENHRTCIAIIIILALGGCTDIDPIDVEALEQSLARTTQTEEEAWEEDLSLIASARGWTFEEAVANREAADAIGRVAEQLAAQDPDAFVGSMVSKDPRGRPTLFVKGKASDFVRARIAEERIEIDVADRQPFSFHELEGRAHRLHNAMRGRGRKVATAVRIERGGVIEMTIEDDASLDTLGTTDDLLADVPGDLRDSVEVVFAQSDSFHEDWAFGGMKALDGTFFECTMGWAVRRDSDGKEGVVTAAHCNGIDGAADPVAGTQNLYHVTEHYGTWGDVEFKLGTTSSSQLDDFYASSSSVRDTASIEAAANITVGESICFYGRGSNFRDCSMDVEAVSVSDGSVDRLVRMNGDGSITGGDSGGGWSWNTTAYGIQHGRINGKALFSVADYFDEAIGVRVMTSP